MGWLFKVILRKNQTEQNYPKQQFALFFFLILEEEEEGKVMMSIK